MCLTDYYQIQLCKRIFSTQSFLPFIWVPSPTPPRPSGLVLPGGCFSWVFPCACPFSQLSSHISVRVCAWEKNCRPLATGKAVSWVQWLWQRSDSRRDGFWEGYRECARSKREQAWVMRAMFLSAVFHHSHESSNIKKENYHSLVKYSKNGHGKNNGQCGILT